MMDIKVTKLTDVDLLRKANSFTTGKDSKMSLARAYRARHTNIRTQMFFVECYDIPQFVAYHLRTHFALYSMPPFEYGWMGSKRVDKGGEDFREVCDTIATKAGVIYVDELTIQYDDDVEHDVAYRDDIAKEIRELPQRFDRYALTRFGFMISAEGLMKLCETRLCIGAVAKETREVVEEICEEVKKVDPDLYPYLVKPCVHKGFCSEPNPCGWCGGKYYGHERNNYLKLFEQ